MSSLASQPAYAALLELLRERIGLDPTSAGTGPIPFGLADMGIADSEQLSCYVDEARHRPALLDALIQRIVVHETWFFREPAAFDVLSLAARRALAAGKRFRVLSAPCSTGEEAYSIAMALTEAGLDPETIDIVALDISPAAIEQARRGVFGAHSFRSHSTLWRNQRFDVDGPRWSVKPGLARMIRFETGNLLDLPASVAGDCFDAVFCRNLLIYLDRPARDKVFRILRGLAQPDSGLLFVGHAESTDAFGGELTRVDTPMSFAFRNRAADINPTAVPRPGSVPVAAPAPAPEFAPALRAVLCVGQPAGPSHEALIDEVRRLADQGHIAAALTCCQTLIAAQPGLADAHAYLGLLTFAMGNTDQARSHWSRALYLNPRHEDSLHHMMLLALNRGDAVGAQRYRDRLVRVSTNSAPAITATITATVAAPADREARA